MASDSLQFRFPDRLRAVLMARWWPVAAWVRRCAALGLFALAVVLALVPGAATARGPTRPVLVAARDLAAGVTLRPGDVRAAAVAPSAVPAGAFTAPVQVSGRVLAGAVRSGEQLTDARLAGAAAAVAGPGRSAVPVRLADPEIGDLLRPGSRVDVVAAEDLGGFPDDADGADGGADGGGQVLATDAVVVTVRPAAAGARDDMGRLVVLALPSGSARQVAALSVQHKVTVTLR